ncbi:MAG: precorrin-6y C5,15-methyltransferase (decarboxylating) subunit CbiE [Thermanaeromonas sp.]|uniref:precorrin-6y C5,15-methyltransferase (decarboxylating) subunit CbiE n=1 Tax=Thermanaeromonas sp. TaxID=2003697 RepID=UPI00243E12A6|nr:precorrin-6y C5,15-methyltransferase (decarboxylating) subunit CbiE [Thermanaeromonas sp.]MCG0278722.1 precorrin-6y C5,15-methyltransferase (decarboxylating) subunit CbiE [Thermanaeromonas sp.]
MTQNRGSWLKVIGIGPGHPSWLTPAAYEAVAQAEILVGGRRALALFAFLEREKRVIDGDLESLRRFLESVRGRPTAVLVSGDPGLYSLLGWLKRHFPEEEITVIPGISSVQLAFARLGCSWEEATILSLHGRPLSLLDPYLEGLARDKVLLALLTGGSNTPSKVGEYLTSQGLGKVSLWVGAELGGPEERIEYLLAEDLARSDFPQAAVIIGGYRKK